MTCSARTAQRIGIHALWPTLLLLALATVPARGESTFLGTLPLRRNAADFSVNLRVEATAGNGYQPMVLEFVPQAATFTRDRQFEVVITPKCSYDASLDLRFRFPCSVPQGSGVVSFPIYVPTYFPSDTVRMEISEEGRKIDTGEQFFARPAGLRFRDTNQASLVGILVGSNSAPSGQPWETFPDVRTLVTVLGQGPLPEDASVHRLTHDLAIAKAQSVQPASVQFRPFDEQHLHANWLGYSQLDVILVASPVLARIEKSQPERFEQLLAWLAAGGNLWVYAATESPPDSWLARLGTEREEKWMPLKALLQADKAPDLSGVNDTSALTDEWGGVVKASVYRSNAGEMQDREDVYKTLKQEGHPFADTVDAKRLLEGVRTGEFGLGRIMVIDELDPFPGSFQFWNAIAQHCGSSQLNWRERLGIDVPAGNQNYWLWLIPSVGQPPLKSFVLLNTIFVILIGPIFYLILRKRRRLHYLYVVAPLLALLVTAGLFAYAIASDGTTTKARSRQLTWIDPKHGFHVEQTRQTYYAVMGSRGGIELSSNTAVFPVRHTPIYNAYGYRNGRRLMGETLFQGERQYLSGEFLPPRDQVQYLTMRPRRDSSGLQFQFGPGEETVHSTLPFAIDRLLVSDRSGGLWEAEGLKAGQSAPMRKAAPDRLSELLGSRVIPTLGEVPMLRNNVTSLGGGLGGVQVSQLERVLNRWSARLPSGHFVGLAEISAERIGVDAAEISDSVHVVMGEID